MFIWKEFQAFINQADAQAMERKHIIDNLGATPEDTQRMQELCFIPTVIFPCVLEIADQYEYLYKRSQREKQRLQGLITHLGCDYPLASNPLKTQLRHCADRAQKELELIEDVFKVKYPAPAALGAWRKHFGIDKRPGRAPQKHRIWDFIIRDLVDCLKPYCEVQKKNTKRPMEVPTDARDTAARLLHLSAPDLWPDGLTGKKAVENRYKKTRAQAKPISSCQHSTSGHLSNS